MAVPCNVNCAVHGDWVNTKGAPVCPQCGAPDTKIDFLAIAERYLEKAVKEGGLSPADECIIDVLKALILHAKKLGG